ncbi:hypothetical protein CYMTET_55073 [Cymbomonas tetramitiformis]|uniref:E3 ubiquitin-protein ligase CHFR n=1 Tax=Cymbomonas tetramitiformis TaxID=36881 RepID=A0AAE0BF78_9CHLO|nr:hypothetical protein CYMTET_55073 [Cymbomonas tetramitiformis]
MDVSPSATESCNSYCKPLLISSTLSDRQRKAGTRHTIFLHRIVESAVKKEIHIGRLLGNDILLVDPTHPLHVSRKHATITWSNEGDETRFYISDNGSSNGTYVDGEKLEKGNPRQIVDGSSIDFGTCYAGSRRVSLFTYKFYKNGYSAKDLRETSVNDADMFQDLTCPICMELIAGAHSLACGHVFCGACIFKWWHNKKVCPQCRDDRGVLVENPIVDNFVRNKYLTGLSSREVKRRRENLLLLRLNKRTGIWKTNHVGRTTQNRLPQWLSRYLNR